MESKNRVKIEEASEAQDNKTLENGIKKMMTEPNIFSSNEVKPSAEVSKVQAVVELDDKSNNIDKLSDALTVLTKEGLSTWNNHIEKKAEAI